MRMCRSSAEPGGPRRCPAHARARLAASTAAVAELELREAALYRAASVDAIAATTLSYRANSGLREAHERVGDLRRQWITEGDRELIVSDYRQAYRDLLTARHRSDVARQPAQEALALLDDRRGHAHVALKEAGLSSEEADAYLDAIDRETGYAPPF
jgi:hypothetical protein